jgi:hypothetical protein
MSCLSAYPFVVIEGAAMAFSSAVNRGQFFEISAIAPVSAA